MNQSSVITDMLNYESFSDFMESIEKSMTNLVTQTSALPKDFTENLEAFKAAVNWNESFIRCVVIIDVILFLIVFITRKNVNVQAAFFFLICLLLYFCETLNHWCSLNWRQLTTQNYFDEHGVFAGIFFAGPLLCICFLQLINFLKMASVELVKVKRLQLAQKKKNDQTEAWKKEN
jgi:hypothetical protein